MEKRWRNTAWKAYVYWLENDKRVVKRINQLLCDIERTPFAGLGRPELLKFGVYHGWWSRQITDKHRLIYKIDGDAIVIAACYGHYDDH